MPHDFYFIYCNIKLVASLSQISHLVRGSFSLREVSIRIKIQYDSVESFNKFSCIIETPGE